MIRVVFISIFPFSWRLGPSNPLVSVVSQTSMFGLYYLIRDVIVSVAAFGGALLWMVSPATNLITAFVCGLLGAIYFAIYGKDLRTGARSAAEISRA